MPAARHRKRERSILSDGIIFVRLGIAEINEHTVAHAFRNKSGKAAHRIGDAAMIGAHDLAQILGIEARRQRRRADQIAKHTVSWRRSASGGAEAPETAAVTAVVGAEAPSTAIASSSRRRWPIGTTPISRRSSDVRWGSTFSSISFARNAGSYCSSPRPRSQAAMSTLATPCGRYRCHSA